jgi:uncharacterized membrane protein YagU involved in acid resistance
MATIATRKSHNPGWAEVAGGVIGGLVGAWVMGQAMSAMTRLAPEAPDELAEDDEPTVKTAAAISEALLKKTLTRRQRKPAGRTVHYAFGALVGAIYGALGAELPVVRAGAGTLYGLGVWLGADELALPALHLTPPAKDQPKEVHAQMAAAHLVFGVVLDSVTRACRHLLADV